MFFRSNKKRYPDSEHTIARKSALDCVPVRNPEIREQKNEQGELCLTYQVRIRPWFQGIVPKFTGRSDDIIERKLQLDELGSAVWHTINGKQTVQEIIADFQATHKLHLREAEISVTAFLKELGKRGLIIMKEEI